MKNNKPFYFSWSIPLAMLIVMNLFAHFIFSHQGSLFFSGKWWSTWFPIYTVALSFLAIGANGNNKNDR
ncbi:MAG TPA: hypothetical protein EYH20_06970 [Leucothrix sp.]|nr:hypothetical protein [Leucothrix sp.]